MKFKTRELCEGAADCDDAAYHKLALNFEIDDIAFAEASVDTRMLGEMERGRTAVASGDGGECAGQALNFKFSQRKCQIYRKYTPAT